MDGFSEVSTEKETVDRDTSVRPTKKSNVLVIPAILICLVVFAGLIAMGILPRLKERNSLAEHTRKEVAQAPFVSVTPAQPGPAIQEFVLPGATQAIQDATIYARVDGYLAKRYVNIGDKVHRGQIMADIDTPELDQQVQAAASSVEQAGANLDNTKQAYQRAKADSTTAYANVRKAKTDLQYYAAELDRYKKLVAEGAVSQEDRDTKLQAYNAGAATLDAMIASARSSDASVNSARAAVHVAQAALDAAKATHDQIQATQSFKKVVAPFDGIVTQRNVDAGALITSGSNSNNSMLFEVAKTDILRVFVYVPEQYVSFVHDGDEAKLEFQEYVGQHFIGIVSNISGGIDPASKTLQVEIHVPNSDHKLLPGMYARVHFECPTTIRQPVVPATTVQTRADGTFIYTVDKNNRVQMHKVEIGRDLGGQFEIAKGIQVGDNAIVNPNDQVQDGVVVNPVVVKVSKSEGGTPKK
jgi:RND family efflux transporter MFP subunit